MKCLPTQTSQRPPWFTVAADDKRRARLNCIHHLLSKIPYEDMTPEAIKLPLEKAAANTKGHRLMSNSLFLKFFEAKNK